MIDAIVVAIVPLLPTGGTLLVVLATMGVSALTLLGITGTHSDRIKLIRFLLRQTPSFAVIGAVALSIATIVKWPTSARPAAKEINGRWPAFQGGPSRSGVADSAPTVAIREVAWRAARDGRHTFYASPAIAGNVVLTIGSIGHSASIFSWNIDTGQLIRRVDPPGFRPTFSSPTIQDNLLVCGEGLHHVRDARVLCVDTNTGEVVWTFRTKSHVECTPWIQGDRVYVGAGDDGIYALALPAKPSGSRVIWHANGKDYPDAETCLAANDTHVYAGLGHGGQALVALDADTGDEAFRLQMPFPVFAPPALVDNKIVLGMGNGNFVDFRTDPIGQVACVNLDDQTIEWRLPTRGTILSAIVADGDEIVFACTDRTVTVASLAGQLLRQWTAPHPILASPAVSEEFIYVVDDGGWLHTLDRQTCRPVSRVSLGRSGRFIGSPVVAKGKVFVGTEQHGFVALCGDADGSNRDSRESLGSQGTLAWRQPLPESQCDQASIHARDTGILVVTSNETGTRANLLDRKGRLEQIVDMKRKTNVVHAMTRSFFSTRSGHLIAVEKDGDESWRNEECVWETPLLVEGPLLIAAQANPRGITAVTTDTGLSVWTHESNALATSARIVGDQLQVRWDNGLKSAHSFIDGKEQSAYIEQPVSSESPSDTTRSPVFRTRDAMFFIDETKIVRTSLDEQRRGVWAEVNERFRHIVAASRNGRHVYVVTQTGSVHCFVGGP